MRYAGTTRVVAVATAAIALSIAGVAEAQTLLGSNSHGTAIAVSVGSYVNFYDYGDYRTFRGLRINPEFQFHGRSSLQAYSGFGGAIGADIYPGYFSLLAAGFSARAFYDIQVISGAAFFLAPYFGATVGGVFGNNAGFFVSPSVGLELKLVFVDRVLLGVRPIGIAMPIVITNLVTTVGFGYDAAITLGITL
ncbi:MAG: hypothetical protein JNK05_11210 [Myxococcales bacterium]|nr:hypothetical protein [Myxococcales bacterium]